MKNKVGRPKGHNRLRATEIKDPVKWKPVHDTVITLHVFGKKSVEIAQQLKLNQTTISNIINCPAGQAKIKELNTLRQENLQKSLTSKIQEIEEASITNIHSIVTKPEEFKGRPIALLDLSTKALKAVVDYKEPSKKNDDKGNSQTTNTQFNFFTTGENAERIIKGLSRLKEIKQKKISA